jgi:hypothetical protein
MTKYILEIDEDQLKHISKSLDFYARIQMGQVSEFANPYMVPLPNADYIDVETKLKELKEHMFPDLPADAYYSVKSKHISDDIRQMIDIFEVIKYEMITEEDDKFKPFHWSSEKDLPKLTSKE